MVGSGVDGFRRFGWVFGGNRGVLRGWGLGGGGGGGGGGGAVRKRRAAGLRVGRDVAAWLGGREEVAGSAWPYRLGGEAGEASCRARGERSRSARGKNSCWELGGRRPVPSGGRRMAGGGG
jgi:hypothetical protein